MTEFEIHPRAVLTSDVEREAILAAPGFGEHFTDHMVTMQWDDGRGWHDARVESYGPLVLDPATSAFHYAQEFFEGLKAYRQNDGSLALFRPESNAARFNRTAARLAMPEVPEETFVRALELLVTHDQSWVPSGYGNSLYLRPFMLATQRGLGFTLPSSSYLFCAIASPVTYLGGTPRPLRVWLSEDYTRAAPGGTGDVKAACNYAPAFAAQQRATATACDQVVWLDAAEHTWVEEMGGMNLFFVYGSGDAEPRLMTPGLTGTLLPGVTRDSLLHLAPLLGITAEEGRISADQWRKQCEAGELTEVFACGTAATLIPIGSARSASGDWRVGDGESGSVTLRLREELMGIQYGHRPDPFGWVYPVC